MVDNIIENLEKHPLAEGVVYVTAEQLGATLPLVQKGFLQAAILHETAEQKDKRTAFVESLTSEQWQLIAKFMPKLRGAKTKSGSLSYNFSVATHPEISPYLIQEMESSLSDVVHLGSDFSVANSEILMRPPNSGNRAKYWTFHCDSNFPITEHKTFYGSGLEWLSTELTDEQRYLLAKDYDGFLDSLEDGDIQTIEQGDAIWFNDAFLHRATSLAATEGYIVKSTSPAVSRFQF